LLQDLLQNAGNGMSKMRLDDRAVARLSNLGEIWHTGLPGFGIRIGARVKVWQVMLRRPGEKHPTRIKLGTFPGMNFAEARKKAGELLDGDAPARPVLFKDRIEEFLEYGRTRTGEPLRAESKRVYRCVLEGSARSLHNKVIAEIRRSDINRLLATVVQQSGASNAALTRKTLGRYWSWLMSDTDDLMSPVVGSQAYAIPERLRPLSDAELGAIWTATEPPSAFHAIVRISLWTGCRRSEAGGARWSELSPDGGIWSIPGSRAKNHRPVALPLAHQTVAYWSKLPRVHGRDHIFGVSSARGFTTWSRDTKRLDAQLRFNEPWILQNTRQTVETRMAGLRIDKEHVNKTLNHAAGPVTRRYDGHDYMAEKAEALQRWADRLEQIVGG
jgi:integrase